MSMTRQTMAVIEHNKYSPSVGAAFGFAEVTGSRSASSLDGRRGGPRTIMAHGN